MDLAASHIHWDIVLLDIVLSFGDLKQMRENGRYRLSRYLVETEAMAAKLSDLPQVLGETQSLYGPSFL